MDEILRRLEALEKRISAIESRFIAGAMQAPAPQMGAQVAPPPPVYRPQSYQAGIAIPPPPPAPAALAGQTKGSVESYIGRKVLGVIGGLAVLFGAAYFLKYAFDSGWIGVVGRITLGIVGGLVFIVIGELLRKKYPRFADILSGLGGLGLLYLSTFAAFQFYQKIDQTTAFGFMAAITAFGVILSLFVDAPLVAVLATVGGFLTPFLLSTGIPPDELTFFGYITILNIGVLAAAFFKKWHALTLVGFIGTMLTFASWFGAFYKPEKFSVTIYILCIFYAIYFLSGVLANMATKIKSDSGDLFILSINPAWFFGWLYFLLTFIRPEYHNRLGFVAAGFAALYVLTAYIASVINSEDKRFTLFLGAIAVLFLTIAIPLQLEQNAITIAWAVEAAILFGLGSFLRNPGMRVFGMVVFAFSLLRLFFIDSSISYANQQKFLSDFVIIFNRRFFTYFMATIAAAIMGYFSSKVSIEGAKGEKVMSALLWTAVNFLIIVSFTMEINTFFDSQINDLKQSKIEEIRRKTPLAQETYPGEINYQLEYQAQSQLAASPQYRSLTNQRNASISVFWTILAVILITLGMLYRSAFLRWSALVLFGVTIIKIFFYDLAALSTPYRIISFMVLGVILLLASFLYYRYQKSLDAQKQV